MDERASERVVADLTVAGRTGAQSFSVVIGNLSATGCMVDAGDEALPYVGSPIEIQLPHIGSVSGVIVWTRSGYCGIQFDERLHQAVVRQIGFKALQDNPEPFRDQFGRPVKPPGRPLR